MGSAPSLPFYMASWIVVGLGMERAATIHDVFDPRALLRPPGARRHHGRHPRGRVCQHRLLAAQRDPRRCRGMAGNLPGYAAHHACVALPLHLVLLAGAPSVEPEAPVEDTGLATESVDLRNHVSMILLISGCRHDQRSISSMLAVHLLTLLQAQEIAWALLSVLGRSLGPAQVLARFAEMAFGRQYHPIWTMLASVSLMALGLVLLVAGPIAAAVASCSTEPATASARSPTDPPLALFGPFHYAALMGRIARPSPSPRPCARPRRCV